MLNSHKKISRTVLVVDDDQLILTLLTDGLTNAGYDVLCADSVSAAEALLGSGPRPDIAILDVRLPGQNGLALAPRLRQLDFVPFVMLSASSDALTVEQATAAGALGYLVKPVDMLRLLPAIEAALACAAELRELRMLSEQLQRALDSGRDTSVAVGVTMVQHEIGRNEAFDFLRATARSQRRKLTELAQEIVAAQEKIFDGEGVSDLRILAQAVMQTADAVAITCAAGVIQFVNPAFEQLTGYSSQEAIGQTNAIISSGTHPATFYATLWQTIRDGEVFRAVLINRRKDGALYHEEKTITAIRDEQGEITHFVSTGRDVSERLLVAARFEYLANHDLLTGLPNRVLFIDRLTQAMLRCQREQTELALLFVDLDRFKAVNDRLGHGVGDAVLVEVANRLRSVVRDEDSVARLGGDEFTVIVEGLKSPADSNRVGQAITAAFAVPFQVENQEFSVGASIGIAYFPSDGVELNTLLKNADTAMFYAKASGRSACAHFSEVQ